MSLRTRLVAAMVSIALLAVLLGGLLARSAARSQIETFTDVEILESEVDAVQAYGTERGAWDGVEVVLEEIDADAGVRLILTDIDDVVLADTRPTEDVPDLDILLSYQLEVDGDPVYLYTFDRAVDVVGEDPLDGLDRQLLVAALVAMAAAALVAVLLAQRLLTPVNSLVGAVRSMGDGRLDARAEVTRSDELGELGTAFNELATTLDRVEHNRRTMVADTAHELRTPLANLRGHLEAIDDGVIDADTETIAALLGDVRRLNRVVDDLQSLALAQAGELSLVLEPVSVHELLGEAVAAHTAAAQASGCTLALVTSDSGARLLADRDRFGQILGNLLSNAARYSTRVEIGAHAAGPPPGAVVDGAIIEIAIDDNGPGIPPSERSQVFERFHRVDPSRSRQSGGTGLGLAIVAQLVEAHGGSVRVEEASLGGARFVVSVPRC